MLAAYPPMKRGVGGVSINVQAGVSVVGSRNVVVFGAGAGAGGEKEGGKRKRGVEVSLHSVKALGEANDSAGSRGWRDG